MKIATVVFGGGVSTLGIDIISRKLLDNDELAGHIEVNNFTEEDPSAMDGAGILLVSLYWDDNLMDYFRFLKKYGVKPGKEGGPKVILGGISAVNTSLLDGFFDYVVLGDGECVIVDLVSAIVNGVKYEGPGVVGAGDYSDNEFCYAENIPAHAYVENRGNRTARIEIARGCRYRCAFCQLAYTKPYREQPIDVLTYLIQKAPTKSVGLFAPDRSGYSALPALEAVCKKYGKNNTAEDLRLDTVRRMDVVSKLKFGVEGFTEAKRREFHKVVSNKNLVLGMKHIFQTLKKPNGKRHTTATMYMIGDLPGETPEGACEFWDVMEEADEYCNPPFTLFLTMNSFSPKPYTPLELCGIHPYNKWGAFWDNKRRLKNITTASRGGMLGPSLRITRMICSRGDQRLTKLLFFLANEGRKIIKSPSKAAGEQVEALIRKQGVDPEFIWGELPSGTVLPHHRYRAPS